MPSDYRGYKYLQTQYRELLKRRRRVPGGGVATVSPGRVAVAEVEALEPRLLLSADPAGLFAQYNGTLDEPDGVAAIEMPLDNDDLVGGRGAYRVGLAVIGDGDTGLDPDAVTVRRADGSTVPQRVTQDDSLGLSDSYVVLDLVPDDYTVQVRGANGTTGRFTIQATLIGDLDGDRSVTMADRVAMFDAFRSGATGGEADTDRDGRVFVSDISNQLFNFGASAATAPLELTVQLGDEGSPTPNADGSFTVDAEQVVIEGQTAAGALLTLDTADDGFDLSDPMAVADADGRFAFTVDLVPGRQTLGVQAIDAEQLGQVQTARIDVILAAPVDNEPPQIDAQLADDTGSSGSDAITQSPVVTGSASDNVALASLEAVITPGDSGQPTLGPLDVLGQVAGDGSFTLDLDALVGSALGDGSYTLALTATDAAGNQAVSELAITLDRTGPALSVALDATDDSGAAGDALTNVNPVALVGMTEPGQAVTLVQTGATTTADAAGQYRFDGVALSPGDNPFTVRAADEAGNAREASVTVTLDQTGPPLTLTLDPASDTGVAGDNLTDLTQVTLNGQTTPGTTVTLVETGDLATADAQGGFAFTGVALVEGDNTFTARVTDAVGNSREALLLVTLESGVITLVESDRYVTEFTQDITVPATPSALVITFDAPEFDGTGGPVNDAFEVAFVDAAGQTLLLPFAPGVAAGRSALFNLSEGQAAQLSPNALLSGDTLTVDLSNLPVGQAGTLVLRLVNNDGDTQSQVRITSIEQVDLDLDTPAGTPGHASNTASSAAQGPVTFNTLSDLTASFDTAYTTTTLNASRSLLQVDVALTNVGSIAVGGPLLLAVTGLDGSGVTLLGTDGLTPAGNGYYRLDASLTNRLLGVGDSVGPVTLEFKNPGGQPFTFDLQVLGQLNRAPQVTSAAPDTAAVGQALNYQVQASDADGDTLSYALLAGPAGMSIDPDTGLLQWQPTASDVGSASVLVRVSDGRGGSSDQSFSILTRASIPNRPPVIQSAPVVDATANALYTYAVQAQDADGDTLNYQLTQAPAGMAIDAVTGVITFQPTDAQRGPHDVTVTVDDGNGGAATQVFTLNVAADAANRPPVFISTPTTTFNLPGDGNSASGGVDPIALNLSLDAGEDFIRDIAITLANDAVDTGFADIVITIDQSGSMNEEQAFLAEAILQLNAALEAQGIGPNRFALGGFGGSGPRSPGHIFDLDNSEPIVIEAYGPDGGLVDSVEVADGFFDQSTLDIALPDDGLYTFVVKPQNNVPGVAFDREITVVDTPDLTVTGLDTVNTLSLGPDDTQAFSFTLNAGMHVYLDFLTGENIGLVRGEMTGPNGQEIFGTRSLSNDFTPIRVPQTGVYTLTLSNASGSSDLTASFRVLDALATSLPFETVVSGSLGFEEATVYTFESEAFERYYFTGLSEAGARWGVFDPTGQRVLSDLSGYENITRDLEVLLEAPGTYTLVVRNEREATAVDFSFSVRRNTLDVADLTLGEIISGDIANAGDAAIFRFQGVKGQRVFYDGFQGVLPNVITPLGESLGLTSATFDDFRNPVTLPETGTYYLRFDPRFGDTDTFSGRLLDFDAATTALAFDTQITGNFAQDQETLLFSFDAEAGDRLFFDGDRDSDRGESVLMNEQNESQFSAFALGFDRTFDVPVDGKYTLVVRSTGDAGDFYKFRVDKQAQPTGTPPTIGAGATAISVGDTVSSDIAAAGEVDQYTFDAQAGDVVSFDALGADSNRFVARIIDPTGEQLSRQVMTVDVLLPIFRTGTYLIEVFATNDTDTGAYSFELVDVLGAPPLPLDTPQLIDLDNGLDTQYFRFTGEAGQRLFVDQTERVGNGTLNLYGPDFELVIGRNFGTGSDFTADLVSDGVYTLEVRGRESGGPAQVGFVVGTPDVTSIPLVLGQTVSSAIAERGEIDVYNFQGAAGQRLFVDALASDSTFDFTIFDQFNRDIFTSNLVIAGRDSGPIVLPDDGEYRMVITASSNGTGSYNFRVIDIDAAPDGSTQLAGTLAAEEAVEVFTIQGVSGQVVQIGGDRAFGTAQEVADATALLQLGGGVEDGYDGIRAAVELDYRPGAAKNVILITDEDRDVVNDDLDFATTLGLVEAANVFLNVIVDADLRDGDGNTALGLAADGTAYVADGSGGFVTTGDGVVVGGFENTEQDYVDFVFAAGDGVAFDLKQLRAGGDLAESFANVFVEITAERIAEQFGRLEVIASDPQALFENLTGQLTGIGPNETGEFSIRVTGDGSSRSFDLLFIRPGSGEVLGSIPVVLTSDYRYAALAQDPDGDAVTYALLDGPAGATIDATTGVLSFEPGVEGVFTFTVEASDGRGGATTQAFDLAVVRGADNTQPLITSTPPASATVNRPFVYQVMAEDADGDALVYLLNDAPDGLSIDPQTGLVTWAPAIGQLGPQPVSVRVLDGRGGEATQSFALNVLEDRQNNSPVFQSAPPSEAAVGEPLIYRAQAVDADGDAVAYDLALAPRGMAIDATTGVLTWTPGADQFGIQNIILRARDGFGGFALQVFELDVPGVNSAPVITSAAPPRAVVGQGYVYQVIAQDAEDDNITYRLDDAPAGMLIDGSTGRIQFTPVAGQAGVQPVTVIARDARGAQDTQTFELTVLAQADNEPPVITSTPRESVALGTAFVYQVIATDAEGDALSYALDQAPQGASITDAGLLRWTPTAGQFGDDTMTVRVTDALGASATQQFAVAVRSQQENSAPVITSTPPQSVLVDAALRYQLTATDADGDALFFTLLEAPAGVALDVVSGLLTWTPTAAQSGTQTLRIAATDAAGASVEQAFDVVVTTVNTPPAITSSPVTDAAVGVAYSYAVQAADINGDTLSFALDQAPGGAAIDSQTGVITWTPAASQAGDRGFVVRVSDGRGGGAAQSFTVGVQAAAVNEPPVFTTTPTFAAEVDAAYVYQAQASDPEGDGLTWSLDDAPAGMSIDVSTGRVTWTPGTGQLGPAPVEVRVTDAAGNAALQRFTVTAIPAAANVGPQITSAPPSNTVALGQPFVYDVLAVDPNGDPLAFSLTDAPDGMSISATGRVTWTPEAGQLGDHAVAIRVADPFGGFVTQSFTLTAIIDDIAPSVSLQLSDNPVDPGTPVTITVQASDSVGIAALDLTVDGTPLAISSAGTATFTPDAVGQFDIVATATDTAGNVTMRTLTLNVTDTSDVEAPFVFIESPEPGDVIDNLLDVVGTVTDDNLAFYSLSIADIDSDQFTELARGNNTVAQDILGQFDPTVLQNGTYRVRLLAEDLGGLQSTDIITVDVTGDLKIGNFTTTFIDLSIPLSGVPIQIARTYDSLQSTQQGEFGFGWRLEVADADLRTNLPTQGEPGDFIFQGFKPGTRVYVTLPGGDREGFTFQAVPDGNLGGFLGIFVPTFVPDPGVTSTLSVQSEQLRFNESLGEFQSYVGLLPYNPAAPAFGGGYTLTREDGTTFDIDGVTGDVETVTDRNGNTLTYTDGGVVSSTGLSVVFERDAKNRITAVIDPDGNRIEYSYDAAGDLVSVTDREDNLTRFTYLDDRPHFLEEVIDPLGRTGITNEYNDKGQLIRHVLADGTDVQLIHDPDNQLETKTDRNGNDTVYEYDLRGNIVTMVDAEGGITRYTYDINNNPLTQTNPVGETLSFTYDSKGYVLSETNPLGETVTYTRNQFGDILTRTDALGNTTTHEYDNAGNRTMTTDALGRVTSFTYDSRGNQTSMTDALGQTTTMQYNARGHVTRMTDARGNTTDYANDSQGNPLTVTRTRTVNGTPVQVVTFYEYDNNGLLTKTIDAEGNEHRVAYDANGDVIARVDGNGGRSEVGYTDFGFVNAFTYADGTQDTETVNGEGFLTSVTDRAGRVTGYQNDELNRLTKITQANGTEKLVSYDAAGRITQTTNARGAERVLAYDAAGRVIRNVDALGNQSTFTYDAAGRELTRTNARGNTTSFTYDDMGRRTMTAFADGTSIGVTYDALDRRTSQTDQLGRTTHFEYDATGNLTKVTDAAGEETTFTYDELGNQLTRTDANGHTTEWAYDNLGRVLTHTRPMGQSESFVYDGNGNIVEHTDFNGATHTFTYDQLDRLLTADFADGETVTYTYTPTGQVDAVTDGRGVTDHTYDQLDRLTRVDNPDGTFVAYTYDDADNVTTLTTDSGTTAYTYDLLDRVATTTDADGGVTAYAYDAAGNVTSRTLPNGAETTYTYDSLDRVATITHETSAGSLIESFTYQRDAFGNITQVTEGTGAETTYTYDSLNRLTAERVTPSGGAEQVTTWTYDAVGNRLTQTVDGDTVTSTYNDNDQLITQGDATFAYDNNGNQTSRTESGDTVTYTYDSQNRMTSVDDGTTVTTYTYDFAGNLVATSDGTTTTVFVLDVRGNAQVIEQRDGTGQLEARYERGRNDELLSQTMAGTTHFVLTDQLGSTRVLTDASQAVTDTFTYTAFGSLASRTGVTQIDHLFNGQRLDAASGLYNLRARYYNPAIGRFMSVDPVAGNSSDPATLHRYLYVHNNPVNGSDASGRFFSSLVDFAVANAVLLQTFTMAATTVIKAAPITAASIIFYRPALEQRTLAIEWIIRSHNNIAGLQGALQMMDISVLMFQVGQKVQNATDKLVETAEAGLGVGNMAASIKVGGAPPEAFEIKTALGNAEVSFAGFIRKIEDWNDGFFRALKEAAINIWNEISFARNLFNSTEKIIDNFGDTDLTDDD